MNTLWGSTTFLFNKYRVLFLRGYNFQNLQPTSHLLLPINSMEQNPSCEANRVSASQESQGILWKPGIHYRKYKILQPNLRLFSRFITWLSSYSNQFLALRSNLKLENHPFSAIRYFLFSIIPVTVHICWPFLYLLLRLITNGATFLVSRKVKR